MDSSILSDRAVKGAKPTGQVYRLREKSQDPDLKGFHLTVSAKGSKSFALARKAQRSPLWRDKVPRFDLTHNPATDVERVNQNGEKPRTRALSTEEIQTLWHGLTSNVFAMAAVRLLICTGQRVEEILGAQWNEFNLEARLWVIPAGRRKQHHKVHADHIVPLSETALEVLRALSRLEGCSWLFPHRDGDKPWSSDSLYDATRRFCIRAEFDHFTSRDLRRTWKQRAGQDAKLGLEIRNRIQGHAFTDVGSVSYDGQDPFNYLEEKTEAMARWDRWLRQALTGESVKVVELRA